MDAMGGLVRLPPAVMLFMSMAILLVPLTCGQMLDVGSALCAEGENTVGDAVIDVARGYAHLG